MSSLDDVLFYDAQMKVALTLGDQAGVDKEEMEDWYEEVCLGETTVLEFFARILYRVTDPDLRRALLALIPSSDGRGTRPFPLPAQDTPEPPSPPTV